MRDRLGFQNIEVVQKEELSQSQSSTLLESAMRARLSMRRKGPGKQLHRPERSPSSVPSQVKAPVSGWKTCENSFDPCAVNPVLREECPRASDP